MTADVELLPLPQAEEWEDTTAWAKRYARAVAEHNVSRALAESDHSLRTENAGLALALEQADAKVKARDAEIEALRSEVSGLRAARIGYASEFPPTEDGDPDVGNIHANIRAMKARAERLAEALRDIESRPWNGVRPIQIAARAALRDHDQEAGNG